MEALSCGPDGADGPWLVVIKLLLPSTIEGVPDPGSLLPPLLGGVLPIVEAEVIELEIERVAGVPVRLGLPPLLGATQFGSVDPGAHMPLLEGGPDGLVWLVGLLGLVGFVGLGGWF